MSKSYWDDSQKHQKKHTSKCASNMFSEANQFQLNKISIHYYTTLTTMATKSIKLSEETYKKLVESRQTAG
ncbi:hypothetical protein DRP04_06755 [Archaeoglobales archaeon]|nr:MAG: hypothetical protein DRP04_06755 [Archaeoglobales archaeon]